MNSYVYSLCIFHETPVNAMVTFVSSSIPKSLKGHDFKNSSNVCKWTQVQQGLNTKFALANCFNVFWKYAEWASNLNRGETNLIFKTNLVLDHGDQKTRGQNSLAHVPLRPAEPNNYLHQLQYICTINTTIRAHKHLPLILWWRKRWGMESEFGWSI